MITRRSFVVGIAQLALASSLNGCKPKGKQAVAFTVRTGIESTGLRIVAKAFTRDTGIPVEINELGRDSYMATAPMQLLTGVSSADVVFIPNTMVPELAAAGAVMSLDNLVNTTNTDLIARYGYQGKTYAVPSDISSMFLFYRKDLIAKPPETWDEFVETSRAFTQSYNPASPTRFGASFSGAPGEDLPKTFYNFLWSYGGDIFRDNIPVIGEAPAIAAAERFRSFVDQKIVAPDITSWGFSQVYEALTNGTVAMAAPFWNATTTLLAARSTPLSEKIGYALIPAVVSQQGAVRRTPFEQSWTLVLSARSERQANAAAFINYVISPTGAKLYAIAGGNPALYSILDDPSLIALRPDFPLLSQSLRLARAEPAITYYSNLQAVMNEVLVKLLTGISSPIESMTEAQNRLAELAN